MENGFFFAGNRMRYRMVLVALALAHACAFGQETGTFQGTVRDAETLKALEAANILLQGTNAGVSAGKDGSFRLPESPPVPTP